jgi:hypothetical protein
VGSGACGGTETIGGSDLGIGAGSGAGAGIGSLTVAGSEEIGEWFSNCEAATRA